MPRTVWRGAHGSQQAARRGCRRAVGRVQGGQCRAGEERRMKLAGMIEGQEQVTWDVWKRVAERTEALGFDGLWRSDHIRGLSGADEDYEVLECWTALTYLAVATQRILFGALVSPMTFREPSMLAMQAAAVADLSGGRLVLGLGAGWNVQEHETFGITLPPMRERMDR